jgi:hypothetical protein
MFRDGLFSDDRSKWLESDIEDLMSINLYVEIFNDTFKEKLDGKQLSGSDIDKDRIILSINKWLKDANIILKQDGTFNHYLPSLNFISKPTLFEKIDDITISRFDALFAKINSILC